MLCISMLSIFHIDCNEDEEDKNLRNTKCKCEKFDTLWGRDVYEYHSPPKIFEVKEWIKGGFTKTKYWFRCDLKIMPKITFYHKPKEDLLCEIDTKTGIDNSHVSHCLGVVKGHLGQRGNLIWLVHGFRGSKWKMKNVMWPELKDTLLRKYPNSIVGFVSWTNAASSFSGVSTKKNPYHDSAVSIWPIGNILAYVNYEIYSNEYPDLGDNTYCIGHSLGAHLCSFYSRMMRQLTNNKFELQKILGLDPAGPFFTDFASTHRLSAADANLVEVWHTNTHNAGIKQRVGHVDIFINGGYKQPNSGFSLGPFDKRSHKFAKIILKYVIEISDGCFAEWLCIGNFHPGIKENEEWRLLKNIQKEDRRKLIAAGCIQVVAHERFRLGQLVHSTYQRTDRFVYWVEVSSDSCTCEVHLGPF